MSSTPSSPRSRPYRRRLWILLGGFGLGVAVLFALLLAPPVQSWLLRRLVARQPGWRLDLERIGIGPTGLDARGVTFSMPGFAASSAPIAIRVAPARLLSKRELRIERVEARKIRLTITPAELAPAPPTITPSPPFDGVLRLLQAPLPWALDAAQLDGDIVVRDAGQSRLTGNFSLRGGGVTSATPGEFAYELAADSMILPPGPDHKFTSAGTIQFEQTPTHGIAHIVVQGDLHLPRYGRLSLPPGHLTIDVVATSGGEDYAARLALGAAASLAIDASLDRTRSTLTGHARVRADQTAAASLPGPNVPRAVVGGDLAFTCDLRSGDLDATITGDLDARDWQRLMPQLRALDAFKGQLTAAIARRGDTLTLKALNATLRGEKSTATASLTVTHSLDLRKLPATPLADIALAHWPIEWANPFFDDTGVQFTAGEGSAEWILARNDAGSLTLTPTRPAAIGSVSLRGDKFPPLPALNVSFRPRIEASATRLALFIDDFRALTSRGDGLEARLTASRESGSGEFHTMGKLRAALPTVFAAPDGTLPFTLNVNWDATLSGRRLQVATLGISALSTKDATPLAALQLERPFDFDVDKRVVVPSVAGGAASADLLRLHFANFPLAWLSRWPLGRKVTGALVAGESALRSTTDGSLAFVTNEPWRPENVSLGGVTTSLDSPIDARLSPSVSWRGDRVIFGLDEISIGDKKGNRVWGRVEGTADLVQKEATAELALDADLPALPPSFAALGPLRAHLHSKARTMSTRLVGAEALELEVKNSSGSLLALDAPKPFIFGLSDHDTAVWSTLAPLRLKLGRVPLASLRPWTGALELGGTLAPGELALSSHIDRWVVNAAKPLCIENFSARRAGRELFRDGTVTFGPGLDLTFICVTQPKFQLVYTGTVTATAASVDFAGHRAIDLDLGLSFKGNESVLLPDTIELTSRVDFASLPKSAALALPERGLLVMRASGDLLGAQPVELSARLTGVPRAESKDPLPPIELTLRGKLSREGILDGGVALLLGGSPRPTDAKFDAKLNLVDGSLHITSALRSQFTDAAALLATARAFSSTTRSHQGAAGAKPSVALARPPLASDATLPFWSELTGSFDLNIGAAQFGLYRIDQVRGRLDVDRRALVLHDLSGEMFAGRWGGGIRIEHDAENLTGEHTLAGEFHIEQFESARVIQTVFPHQLSSVEARIDVRAKVTSHGNSFVALADHSIAEFTLDGENGVVRLAVPKADVVSTAAVFGGTVLLSPELRALGRLLKKFAEMPIDRLHIEGQRAESGEVTMDEFRLESPQARLLGHGRIRLDAAQPLMNRPLELSLDLAAKEELAVILGGMSLLEKRPRADGFCEMRQTFTLGGRTGAPDTTALYDLLAKGVSGSSGTWGILMRKVEAEIEKKKVRTATLAP